MLVLKVNRKDKIQLFHGGRQIGTVSYDRNDRCSSGSVRLIFDFEKDVEIFRDKVLETNPQLRANFTFRSE